MKRRGPFNCDVIIFALAGRLKGFYAAGQLHAFVPEPPVATLLGELAEVRGRILVVTDAGREETPSSPGKRVKYVHVPKSARGGVGAAAGILQRERLRHPRCLLLDASAPYVEWATLKRLIDKIERADVATLGAGVAVALGPRARDAFTRGAAAAPDLAAWVDRLRAEAGWRIESVPPRDPGEALLGDAAQIHAALAARRLARAIRLVESGLRLRDPASFDLRGRLRFGRNVTIDAHAMILGDVVLGDDVAVGPHCILEDARVGAGTTVKEFTTITGSAVGRRCRVGPFARIRPGCALGPECHIGNYVEMKTATLRAGCKINHHSFIGDASLGRDVIIGAGSITCNYDGARVQRTTIGDGAFVGSGVMLIAPIAVGRGAFVAAGSAVSKAAPARSLTIARAKQVSLAGWKKKTSH